VEFIVVIKLVDKTNQKRNVLTITFEHDMRVILWSYFACIRSLILWLACEKISHAIYESSSLILLLGLSLCHTESGYGCVLWWYLFLWKRWSVLQIEAEDFPNPMVLVYDVLLSPSGVFEASVCICAKHFVIKSVLPFVYITFQINMLAKCLKIIDAVLV
jgi:hypothetical protein